MRVEPFSIDSIVHVIKRGTRGMEIARDDRDRRRFLSLLFYLNDEFRDENWERNIDGLDQFERPLGWPKRKPLAEILAFTLMPNHLHLMLREIREGGISKLMQKVYGSMTTHFNLKYQESGSMFQGAYRARTVDSDEYLRYVACYVMVKNTFELFPNGGLRGAMRDFEKAWQWAFSFQYSSFASYASGMGESDSPIIAPNNILCDIFPSPREFKKAARDMLDAYMEKKNNDLISLQLED